MASTYIDIAANGDCSNMFKRGLWFWLLARFPIPFLCSLAYKIWGFIQTRFHHTSFHIWKPVKYKVPATLLCHITIIASDAGMFFVVFTESNVCIFYYSMYMLQSCICLYIYALEQATWEGACVYRIILHIIQFFLLANINGRNVVLTHVSTVLGLRPSTSCYRKKRISIKLQHC